MKSLHLTNAAPSVSNIHALGAKRTYFDVWFLYIAANDGKKIHVCTPANNSNHINH